LTHHDDASTFGDVLARFGDDGTKDLFRRLLEKALQDLIDAEVTAQVGAGRHERTESRSNYRNGVGARSTSQKSPRRFVSGSRIRSVPWFERRSD